MKLPTLSEVIAEIMWRAMGWVCNTRPNAVLVSLVHAFEWRSTTWWQNLQAEKMREDPYNHTCWKHIRGWHNRRCVWDKIPTEWSGKENGARENKCCTEEDKRDFVTFALSSVKHSVAHRPRIGERSKPVKEKKEPKILGPADISISYRTEGTTVQMCGDSNVAEKWINGYYALGEKYKNKMGGKSNTGKRKAIRGLWDGGAKANGRCGCGVIIKGADRDTWVTISKIAVPLRTCSAMTGEVVGACIFLLKLWT